MKFKKRIKDMDIHSKLFVLFLGIFSISVILSWTRTPGVTNHSMLGLFYLDFFKWWVGNPTLSLSAMYQFGMGYLTNYPILSVYYPPLFHFTLSFFFFLFGVSWFSGKLLVLIYSLMTLTLVFKLGEELWNKEVGLIASVFLGFSPLFFLMGRRISQEVPLLFFFLLSFFFYLRARKNPTWKNYLLGGLFLGLGFLTKWLILSLVPIAFFLSSWKLEDLKKLFSSFVLAGLVSLPWVFVAYKINALLIPLVSSIYTKSAMTGDPGTFSLMGLLYYPLQLFEQLSPLTALVGIISLIYFLKKKGKERVILPWILFVFLLVWPIYNKEWRFTFNYLPAFCLLIGWSAHQLFDKFGRKKVYALLGVLLVAQILFLGTRISFSSGTTNTKIANFLGKNSQGPVFVPYSGNGLGMMSINFYLAERDMEKQVYRGCILFNESQFFNEKDKGLEYFEKVLRRENIEYVLVPEDAPKVVGAPESMEEMKEIIQSSNLLKEVKEIENVHIYKNKNFDPELKKEGKCNYVCAIQKWVCENTTMSSFEPLS